jgi:hypothetical protein
MGRTAIQKSIQGRSLGLSVSGALVINFLDGSQILIDGTGLTYTDANNSSSHVGGGNTALWGQISGTIASQTDLVSTFAAQASPAHSGTGTGTLAMPATWTMVSTPSQADNSLKVATTAYVDTLGGTKAAGGTTVTSSATSITLSAATHNGNVLVCTASSPVAVTCNTGLGAGFGCTIFQAGTGIVTVSGSATLNGDPSTSTSGVGTQMTLINTATDTYYVLSPINGVTINNQTGTTYTLVASDAGGRVDMSNASANTLTIPSNASVPFPVGTVVNVRQGGAGATTVAISTDTLVKPSTRSFTISAQYEQAVLTKTGTTTWECLAS